jgi:apolipoprotein N-acyltransferase
LHDISQASNAVPVALGALRIEGDTLRNALAVLGPGGALQAVYDKHHLVPFGEYIPFAHLAERVGLRGLVAQSVGFSAGPGPELIDFGPLGKALPLICYEAVFAQGVNAAPARPAFLLQVTNDAWFGTHAGPQQHLAHARMRAIEQGLPLARAANTGVSAMIDPYGRVTASLPLGQAGFVDAPLPAPFTSTFYSRTGDTPIVITLVLLLAVVFTRHRKNVVPESN